MDETPEIGRLLKISTHTRCSDIWAAVVRLGGAFMQTTLPQG